MIEAPVGAQDVAAERGPAATAARLLAAGADLFAARGFHAVTTHDIARHAGVAAGTFYLHFKDKSDLYRAIAQRTVAALQDRLDAAAPGRGTRDGLRARVAALVDFADQHRDLVRILFRAGTKDASVEAEVLDELAARIAQGRSASVAAGEMPRDLDPGVVSQALVGMLARVIAWWVEDPTRIAREDLIETLTQIQLAGTHPPAGGHSKRPEAKLREE